MIFNKKALSFFIVFLIPIWNISVLAQDRALHLKESFEHKNLTGISEFREDISGDDSLEEILGTTSLWKKTEKGSLNRSYTKSKYWIRTKLYNDSPHRKNLVFEGSYPRLARVDFFIPEQNIHQVIDRRNPPPGEERWDTFPFFFSMEPESELTVYFRMESKMDLVLETNLYDEFYFHRKYLQKSVVNSMFYGIMLIMVFYNVFLFFYLGDKVYVAYVFYSVTFLMYILSYYGIGYKYVWGDWTWLQERETPFWMSLVFGIFAPEFLLRYLNTDDNYRHSIKKLLRGVQIGAVFLFCYVLIADPNDSIRFFPPASLVVVLISIYAIVLRIRDGYVPAWFVLMGFAPLMASGVLAALRGLGFLPSNLLTLYGMLYASAIDLVVLSLGLAYRIKILKQNEQKAINANEAKSEFIAQMSHEIRTPLQGLETAVRLLIDEDDPKELDKLQSVFNTNFKNLSKILNDILDFSKMEAGYFSLQKEPIDLKEILIGVHELFRAKAQEKNLEFRLDHPPSPIPLVLGDGTRIQQVLNNLVGNAMKFTSEGSILIRYEKMVLENGNRIYFEIEDTGIGIKKETVKNLFQNFAQADESITGKFGGTGLGLAICKKIVELMGGEVGVESVHGKGSKFWFWIPEEIPLGLGGNHPENYEKNFQSSLSAKILLLEDSPELRMLFSRTLSKKGYTMETTDSIDSAIQIFRRFHPDIILSDYHLNGGNVVQFVQKIQESGAIPPTFVLTGENDSGITDECLELGIQGVYLKPVDFEMIHKLIQNSLREIGK